MRTPKCYRLDAVRKRLWGGYLYAGSLLNGHLWGSKKKKKKSSMK